MDLKLITNDNGVLEAQCDAPEWSQGDDLICFLKEHFGATIIDKAEGPDARMWKLRIAAEHLIVHQLDTGDISFFVEGKNDGELVASIAESIRFGLA